MAVKKVIKNNRGISLIETLIAIAILSVVLSPVYFSILNGYKLFNRETEYQSIVSEVQIFYDELNSRVRLAGFRDTEIITTNEILQTYEGIRDHYSETPIMVFRVKNTFYYLEDGYLNRFSSNAETTMVNNVTGFNVQDSEDKQILTITTTIGLSGRQEKIETRIYDRYKRGD